MLVTKFKTKKILKDTLRDMRQGETITIRVRDFKANAIRNAACLLKNEGETNSSDVKIDLTYFLSGCEIQRYNQKKEFDRSISHLKS